MPEEVVTVRNEKACTYLLLHNLTFTVDLLLPVSSGEANSTGTYVIGGVLPGQQQDKSPDGVQTQLAEVAADSDEMMKLMNLQRLGGGGEMEGRAEQQRKHAKGRERQQQDDS
ncbi:hypothetical protein NQZ68_036529 [Dissostichus eleginoides]|nr:hypothetical protein NQZ68_036529 [Dissostichus eleginoides]